MIKKETKIVEKNELPSWCCFCCGKVYYDNLKEMDYKCTECGSEYNHMFTVTKTKFNDDGTMYEEIIHQKEIGCKNDKERNENS